ncbi:MAG: DUF4019 domain-containing protein [Brasilonema sp.]
MGTIISLTFIGSLLFGAAGISVRFGNMFFGFAMGSSYGTKHQQDDNAVNNITDLENKTKAVEETVKQFHTQLDQGKCKETHEQANQVFKQAISQLDFLNLCEKMRRELGTAKSTQLLDSWKSLMNQSSDEYILSRYYTTFSNVSAEETFVWLVKKSKPELIQYQINPVIQNQVNPVTPKQDVRI